MKQSLEFYRQIFSLPPKPPSSKKYLSKAVKFPECSTIYHILIDYSVDWNNDIKFEGARWMLGSANYSTIHNYESAEMIAACEWFHVNKLQLLRKFNDRTNT